MNKSDKALKKTVPRLIAIALALIMGVLMFAVNRYLIYTPEKDTNDDVKFVIPKTKKTNKKESETELEYNEDSYNFLVMGHDRAASLTDVMMLINYNIKKQSVTIMQIPRDTYFEIDNYYYHKINGLYNYCVSIAEEEGSKNPQKDGCIKTADYLEKNLGVKIHYSAVMDLDGFEGIVDAIGGVDMYVPMRMYYTDPTQNLVIDLHEGYQHLDGPEAEEFVRFRYGYINGDIGRGDAQKLFLSAFAEKLMSNIKDVSTISALAKNVITFVETDVNDADIVYFAKNFLGFGKSDGVSSENIRLFTMPGESSMYGDASMYGMNKEFMLELLDKYYNIYNFNIETVFDTDGVFETDDASALSDIYNMDKQYINFVEYTADSLSENGLEN